MSKIINKLFSSNKKAESIDWNNQLDAMQLLAESNRETMKFFKRAESIANADNKTISNFIFLSELSTNELENRI